MKTNFQTTILRNPPAGAKAKVPTKELLQEYFGDDTPDTPHVWAIKKGKNNTAYFTQLNDGAMIVFTDHTLEKVHVGEFIRRLSTNNKQLREDVGSRASNTIYGSPQYEHVMVLETIRTYDITPEHFYKLCHKLENRQTGPAFLNETQVQLCHSKFPQLSFGLSNHLPKLKGTTTARLAESLKTGHIYLITPEHDRREAISRQSVKWDVVFKVGKTSQTDSSRMETYGKYGIVWRTWFFTDVSKAETDILQLLKDGGMTIVQGNEYFAGDPNVMKQIIDEYDTKFPITATDLAFTPYTCSYICEKAYRDVGAIMKQACDDISSSTSPHDVALSVQNNVSAIMKQACKNIRELEK